MTQNPITLTYTPDQITAIDQTLSQLENQLQGLVSLSIGARRTASKMGPKSEAFCRQTVNALRLYPQIVPPSIRVDEAHSCLDTLDQLRPLFQRLHRLSDRSTDTALALGSEAMVAALQGYGVMKSVGRSQGLDALRRELGVQRFTKGGRLPADVPADAPAAVLKAAA
jgi:hypothetical protein